MADSGAPSASNQPAASAATDTLIGRIINERFKVVAMIARGGMGKVYRAEQAPLGRVCALKVLNPNYAGDSDPEFHKRFFLEASIASKLTHPNTVTIFDYGRTDDDIFYMAMEYLEGRTLHRAIKEESPFAEERAAHIARQICRALREAHSLGVIHRDLKPANVYLVEHADEQDFVKVLDFGLVKNVDGSAAEELTQAGLFMGSPKYMSPEQIRGDKVDARTDIYSLGIVLYEMVTGKVPFDRANSVNILMAHVNEAPPPLREMNPTCDATPQIESVIMRCIAKDPNERFASMDEVLGALKRTGSGALTGTMMGATGEFAAVQGSGLFGTSGASATLSNSGPQSALSGTSQSGPVPLGDPAAPPKKSGKGLIVGVAVALLAAAGAAFVLTRGGEPAPLPAASSAAPAATPPPPASTAPVASVDKPKPPQKVTIKVDSEPSGATVRLHDKDGDELCKDTPCEVTFKGADAAPGREVKLYFTKRGHSSETKTLKLGTDEKVSVKLSAQGGGGPRPAAPAGPGPDSPGFKPVPY
ncbi:MAG: serine/threonine protein kinase [Polyangiaceae bacterium]|nr:serine/threonine protein kinase [Polyangiaceae bacterium]